MKNRIENQRRVLAQVVKDTSYYDGPSKDQVYNSFVELFTDLAYDLNPYLNRINISLISKWILRFLDAFWKQSRSCKDGHEVKYLAEKCKLRRNDLLSIASELLRGKAPAFPGDYYVVSNDAIALLDLHYYPNSFIAVINYMKEINEMLSFVELTTKPGFYVYLHKILFHIVSSFDISEEEYEQNKEKIAQILLLPVSLGQVYEHMNPTPEVMEEYGIDLLSQLRQESTEPSEEFWQLFNQVVNDINKPKRNSNRYVHDIIDAKAAFNHSSDLMFKDCDYYLTAKASTSNVTIDGKKRKFNSLFSSILEEDPIRDFLTVKAYDNLIGYQSGYLMNYDLPDHIQCTTDMVITQMIPNPGKYKPRCIHKGCNAVQDRCKFLHRIFANFLNQIESCCMNNHYRGVQFLKRVTIPSYRLKFQNNVFVSDFTNATDTMNQEFQCKVIEVFFNKTYAEFWKFVSELPKKFQHPIDHQLESYTQMTGQPQGLLASFDAFSLAHIFLVCMLMKKFNLEQRELKETLAIVGDDSVISYPKECEIDVEGITFYEFHSWLCKEVNLIKNDSKTGKSFFDQSGQYSHEVLDFAKISIKDGVFITPIPFGLASGYSIKPGSTDLQLILWLNSKGLTYKQLAYKKLLHAYCKQPNQLMAATSVLSSGEIPFLKGFEDNELYSSIDSSIRGVSLYAFYLNQLEHTFLASILSGNQEDLLKSEDFLDRSLNSLQKDFIEFDKDVKDILPLLSPKHKYNIMLEKNMQLAMDLQDVLNCKGRDENLFTFMAVLVNEDYSSLFQDMLRIQDCIFECVQQDDENIWQMFSYQDFSPFRKLVDPIKGLQVKSMKKVSSNLPTLLRSSARKTSQIIQHSSYLEECTTFTASNFLDAYFKVMGSTE